MKTIFVIIALIAGQIWLQNAGRSQYKSSGEKTDRTNGNRLKSIFVLLQPQTMKG